MFSIDNAINILSILAGGERPMAQIPKAKKAETKVETKVQAKVTAPVVVPEPKPEPEVETFKGLKDVPVWEGGEVGIDFIKDLPQWGRSGRNGWKELEDDNGLRWVFPADFNRVNELVASYCSPWRMNNGSDKDGGPTPLFRGDRKKGYWEFCTPALVDHNNRVVRQGTVR